MNRGFHMRRKLFFFLEKLEINRSERIAVTSLLVILITLSGYNAMLKPGTTFDEAYYAELETLFFERSQSARQENEMIMARYRPQLLPELPVSQPVIAAADTIINTHSAERTVAAVSELININTASAEKLQELPGIGPAYAQRIADWREENGEFTSKEQLLEIRGIGERRLEAIKPLITL